MDAGSPEVTDKAVDEGGWHGGAEDNEKREREAVEAIVQEIPVTTEEPRVEEPSQVVEVPKAEEAPKVAEEPKVEEARKEEVLQGDEPKQ